MAGDSIAVSDLTRAEVLVMPLAKHDTQLLRIYQSVFTDPNIQVLPITPQACERAAAIRAARRFKLPDALHLAIAAEAGCRLFLTNDLALQKCQDVSVEVLT